MLDVVDTYAGVAEDHGRSLLAGRIDEADLDGDSELLTQMLANLIENAITHCPAGATIAVGLVHCEHDLSLTVADDGREKVFRRLYRLDKSRGTAGSDLGLSLALEGIRTNSPQILSSCCTGTARVAWFDRRESGIEIVTHLRQTNA
nr:sensor histidine kinase [uncultured Shinella sp.]